MWQTLKKNWLVIVISIVVTGIIKKITLHYICNVINCNEDIIIQFCVDTLQLLLIALILIIWVKYFRNDTTLIK